MIGAPGAFDDFAANFAGRRTQLVSCWLPADLDTPVSAYLKLCGDQDYALLLESVEGGAVLGRYSAIALKPDYFWRHQDGVVSSSTDGTTWHREPALPVDHLREQIRACRIDALPPDLPPMAASGLFGYFGYDMIRVVEDIPDANPDRTGIPQALLIRPRVMVIFDNIRHEMMIALPIRHHAGNCDLDARSIYDAALAELDAVETRLSGPLHATAQHSALPPELPVSHNVPPDRFRDMVNQAIEYIHAGEIFQVVLSQRLRLPFDLPSFDLYRALRRINPSPFLFHLKLGGFSLVGSSPEILVRVRKGRITIRPIAGTRKRGHDGMEDQALADELLADPKERSEHLMLLDLGRNDVGRAASIGSVRVTERFQIERYSHVMHIISNVEGQLRDDLDSLDALFAGFPAGTVSGAPKIRAMEIIDELEAEKRSFYGGCIGYFDGNGDIDSCIALRTCLVKDGEIIVQAGAGVVADSDPEAEHQECLNKARAIIRAAEVAVTLARQPNSRRSG